MPPQLPPKDEWDAWVLENHPEWRTRPGYVFDAPGPSIHRIESYGEYLQTEHWREVRALALDWAGYKCQLCGRHDMRLNVHHNSYVNLGHEEQEDLIVLCENCHRRYHGVTL